LLTTLRSYFTVFKLELSIVSSCLIYDDSSSLGKIVSFYGDSPAVNYLVGMRIIGFGSYMSYSMTVEGTKSEFYNYLITRLSLKLFKF
jgi:hypothetical protein